MGDVWVSGIRWSLIRLVGSLVAISGGYFNLAGLVWEIIIEMLDELVDWAII